MPPLIKKPRTKKQKKFAASITALALLTALGAHNIGDKCGGVQRWDVKTLTDDKVDSIEFTPDPSTIASLELLNPPKWGTKLPRQKREMKVYTIECTITKFIWEDDDDLHLVLKQGEHTMVGEIPDPFCPDNVSGYSKKFERARKNFNKIAAKNEYKNHRFRITGVLFFDKPAHGEGHSDNGSELHPIIALEVIN
jgi:hypothetical protein